MTTTISNTLTHGIVLNSGNYGSDLTITTDGDVTSTTYGQTGIFALAPNDSIGNSGTISGGQDGTGVHMMSGTLTNDGLIMGGGNRTVGTMTGGAGGAGVVLQMGVVTNDGTILGGFGAAGGSGYYGGRGGDGASLQQATLFNNGTVAGGAGGGNRGDGGVGIFVQQGVVSNAGVIVGGTGGPGEGYVIAGTGGAGLTLNDSTLTNEGRIIGGVGGVSTGNNGEYGGDGLVQTNGAATNDGTIAGGAGSNGLKFGRLGGIGVALYGGVLTNNGEIIGGAGVNGDNMPGAGGAGLYLNGGTVTNAGTIAGGAGGVVLGSFGQTGDAVRFGAAVGTLVIDPGAVFSGYVAADSGVADVLVLAAGTTAGTLSGLGSQFTGFSTLIETTDANWIFDSTNTLDGQGLVAGLVANDGTISGNGTLTVTGRLLNNETINGDVGLTVTGALTNEGTIDIDAGLTLTGVLTNTRLISGQIGNYGSYSGGHGSTAIYMNAGILNNNGLISGGGGGGSGYKGGAGASGVLLSGGALTNAGTIDGGAGGANHDGLHGGDYDGLYGGAGGAGVDVTGGTLTNQSIIDGGDGGESYNSGGTGGDGVFLGSGTVTNQTTISGGTGGAGFYAGNGGAGVGLTGGSLTNDKVINGGVGGASLYGVAAGQGGAGISLADGTITNDGTITGGVGGGGQYGGAGGAGVELSGGSLTNDRTISGGAGGAGTNGVGGVGGVGAALNGGSLTNDKTIDGGAGGAGNGTGAKGGKGGAGIYLSAGTITNDGTIADGAGGIGTLKDGVAGDAVQFGTAVGTLIVDPGAVFIGNVVADSRVADVLMLALANNTGMLTGLGTQFTGFSTLIENTGARWIFTGTNTLAGTVIIKGALTIAGTATNDGTITDAGGVMLTGALINNGTIDGGYGTGGLYEINYGGNGTLGVSITAGTLDNKGIIDGGAGGGGKYGGGSGGAGIMLAAGTVTNDARITGGDGGYGLTGGGGGAGVLLAGGILTNNGAITGGGGGYDAVGGAGVRISGGSLINDKTIGGGDGGGDYHGGKGGAGIYLNGGTLTNDGTIVGGTGGSGRKSVGPAGDAVQFGTAVGTLIIDPGAVFIGSVVADASVADVLVLASANSVGTLSGFGSQFSDFSTLDFGANADWIVEGSTSAFADLGSIDGFVGSDTIVLDGFADDAADTTYVAGVGLELTDTLGNRITLDFVEPVGATTANFTVTDPQAVTTITYTACFAAGTRILSADGRLVRVEDLRVGEALELFDGTAAPIRWIGLRTLAPRRHPSPGDVQPILITRGALGHGLPWRDLVVSPDHAMYLQNHLIPAKALLNGFTIRQLQCTQITYYHIELPAHAVIFAEGAAAESYLESGNRGAFENGGAAIALHPDFANSLRLAKSCAPLVEDGPVVEAVRAGILQRAEISTTDDPALSICYQNGSAIINSRAAVPGEIFADPRDRRRLGVKVARLEIGGKAVRLDHPALAKGWHDVEFDGRWTDGHAVIPLSLVSPGAPIAVSLAAVLRYPINSEAAMFLERPTGS